MISAVAASSQCLLGSIYKLGDEVFESGYERAYRVWAGRLPMSFAEGVTPTQIGHRLQATSRQRALLERYECTA